LLCHSLLPLTGGGDRNYYNHSRTSEYSWFNLLKLSLVTKVVSCNHSSHPPAHLSQNLLPAIFLCLETQSMLSLSLFLSLSLSGESIKEWRECIHCPSQNICSILQCNSQGKYSDLEEWLCTF
jgi:hypothetical protein